MKISYNTMNDINCFVCELSYEKKGLQYQFYNLLKNANS